MKKLLLFLTIFTFLTCNLYAYHPLGGCCLDFDGDWDYISVSPGVTMTSDFTLIAWIHPDSIGNPPTDWHDIIGNHNDGFVWGIKTFTHRLGVWQSGSGTVLDSNTIFQDNQWYFVCFVKDGNNLKLYVNGQLDAQTNSNVISFHTATTIGQWIPDASGRYDREPWNGKLDELVIIGRALNDLEISYYYNNGEGREFQPNSDTLAIWHFNEGTGEVVYDSSGNNNTGQFHHGADWYCVATPTPTVTPTPAPLPTLNFFGIIIILISISLILKIKAN